MSAAFEEKIHQTLADSKLQLAIYAATGRLIEKRRNAVDADVCPDYQKLRSQANAVKRHTIEHLDYYLELFERNVVAHGGKVIFCKDAEEVADFVLGLAKERQASLIVKSKSMTTEEIDLNERLEHHQLEAVETDLGEYLIQLAHERPYHIVAPALHKTREQVADLLTERLGVPRETVIEKQTMIARAVLREKFLAADIGISGANFLVADSGAVVLVENEGNGRTKVLADREKRESLYCIRCGACLNTCPVYRKIGGHSFPWIYSGPIGAILTPQFMGVSHEPGLPFASSLCGACGEVCPVKIDIPKILLELRSDVKKAETREKQNRIEKLAFRVFAWLMTHPRLYELAGRIASSMAPGEDGKWIRSVPAAMNLPPVRAWLSQRDLPPPPAKSFREMWRQR